MPCYFSRYEAPPKQKACPNRDRDRLLAYACKHYDMTVYRSEPDLCHHHAMFTINFITYSAFFRAVFFGFAAGAAALLAFAEAVLFKRALMALRLLELPKEPIVRLPLADFLSPFPMCFLNTGASILKSL